MWTAVAWADPTLAKAVAHAGRLCGQSAVCPDEDAACVTRAFLDGTHRRVPAVVAAPSRRIRFNSHLRPAKEAAGLTYMVHLLSGLQAELGATGHLAAVGCLSGNTTRLVWDAVMLSRRAGERILAEGRPPCSREFAEVARLAPERGEARWLILNRGESPEAVLRNLLAAEHALVRGGILVVEGLNDMYDAPWVPEGFHAYMNRDGGGGAPESAGKDRDELDFCGEARPPLVPFLRLGTLLVLAHPAYAEAYTGMMTTALPGGAFIGHEKFMYGGEILILSNFALSENTLTALYSYDEANFELAIWAGAFHHHVVEKRAPKPPPRDIYGELEPVLPLRHPPTAR